MPAFSTCPVQALAGGTLIMTGTVSNCAAASRTVTYNGSALPHSWSCVDGIFTIKIDPVPAKVPGETNVVQARVTEGDQHADCDVPVV